MLLQVARLALLAGVGIQAVEALLQGHLQLLLIGVGVISRPGGHDLFLQDTHLSQTTKKIRLGIHFVFVKTSAYL